jgi:hypothetical protein
VTPDALQNRRLRARRDPALVNEEVVAQHAEEAAFLGTLRQRAVSEPHYALKDLMVLDQRVEAHLDGLRGRR